MGSLRSRCTGGDRGIQAGLGYPSERSRGVLGR
jgi:hypothetical protein